MSNQYNCNFCDRNFGTFAALQQHLSSPAHILLVGCANCDREFSSQEALDQHLRDSPAHHFECTDCERDFSSQEALDQHLRDSPAHHFGCADCERDFSSQEALDQHLRDSPAHYFISRSSIVREGWGNRPNFQASYGLGMTPDGLESGNILLRDMQSLIIS